MGGSPEDARPQPEVSSLPARWCRKRRRGRRRSVGFGCEPTAASGAEEEEKDEEELEQCFCFGSFVTDFWFCSCCDNCSKRLQRSLSSTPECGRGTLFPSEQVFFLPNSNFGTIIRVMTAPSSANGLSHGRPLQPCFLDSPRRPRPTPRGTGAAPQRCVCFLWALACDVVP